MKEGSYIQKLIDLAKEEGETFEERNKILQWAADIDSNTDHPLQKAVRKIYFEMSEPDKDAWNLHQVKKSTTAAPKNKPEPKPELTKEKDRDQEEIDNETGANIKTKSKVLDTVDEWVKD